jgi:hypothetical protein
MPTPQVEGELHTALRPRAPHLESVAQKVAPGRSRWPSGTFGAPRVGLKELR